MVFARVFRKAGCSGTLFGVATTTSSASTSTTSRSLVRAPLVRRKYTYRSGALKPMPEITPFGLVGVICTVIPGLLIGATISKNMANFLEENDLFVPSDDDDDDD